MRPAEVGAVEMREAEVGAFEMRLAEVDAFEMRPCRGRRREGPSSAVDGGVNPRKSGDDRKSGTRIAAPDQTLLAVFRSDANGCSVALCQRRQPPKAGAVGQRLQRVAGQSSWTIKNDGWFRIAQVRLTRERPYAKTVRFSKRTHRRLRADSRRRQHPQVQVPNSQLLALSPGIRSAAEDRENRCDFPLPVWAAERPSPAQTVLVLPTAPARARTPSASP